MSAPEFIASQISNKRGQRTSWVPSSFSFCAARIVGSGLRMVFTEDQAKDLFGTHFPRESGFLVGGKKYRGFESRSIRISFNMSYLPSCTSVLTSECETFLQRIKSANTNRNAVIEGPRVLQVPRPFLSLPPSLVALCSNAAG
jgi:hypothetical protein